MIYVLLINPQNSISESQEGKDYLFCSRKYLQTYNNALNVVAIY